jgi:hypothetical protein
VAQNSYSARKHSIRFPWKWGASLEHGPGIHAYVVLAILMAVDCVID